MVIARSDAAVTVIAAEPVMAELVTLSVPAIVCMPAVSRVAETVAVPAAKVVSAGSFACGSELVKCTVPA